MSSKNSAFFVWWWVVFFFLRKAPQNKVVSASKPVYMRLGGTTASTPHQSQLAVLHWIVMEQQEFAAKGLSLGF